MHRAAPTARRSTGAARWCCTCCPPGRSSSPSHEVAGPLRRIRGIEQEEAMPELSSADHADSPPSIAIPREYNGAHDLIQRNLRAARADKSAFIDDLGNYTYAELDRRTSAFANVLRAQGLGMEDRILLCLHDTIDFPTAFLGAIKAGVVPVAVNTVLTTSDYEYMAGDSRAAALFVSQPLMPAFAPLVDRLPDLRHVVVSGTDAGPHRRFSDL